MVMGFEAFISLLTDFLQDEAVMLLRELKIGHLNELPYLSSLKLHYFKDQSIQTEGQQLEVEVQLDMTIPPYSLRKFGLYDFFGRCFPKWMALSLFQFCVSLLIKLEFKGISSWTQLPSLGQLFQLKQLKIQATTKVKNIGPEFLGVGINSTTKIAFQKLEMVYINKMDELEE
ncbi:hypothetical protein IEQ34_003414 [Dendrobium chrysotoxum]|uniref:R13L1/DRL21-like LRR repeat region domain-containing protein n=1 Tax=Dendrobium chrysotoxum TaxID=161865 RepID=A0AAV7HIL6_DENCH|nr:hypothetical protein IEQ34_003414 [Dendrobium chrysotoxum]